MVEWKVAVARLEAGHQNNIESLIGLHAKVTAHANVISCAATECFVRRFVTTHTLRQSVCSSSPDSNKIYVRSTILHDFVFGHGTYRTSTYRKIKSTRYPGMVYVCLDPEDGAPMSWMPLTTATTAAFNFLHRSIFNPQTVNILIYSDISFVFWFRRICSIVCLEMNE